MRRGVYSSRTPGNYSEPALSKELTEPLGLFHPVMRASPGAHYTEGNCISLLQFTANVQNRRAIRQNLKRFRVIGGSLRNNLAAIASDVLGPIPSTFRHAFFPAATAPTAPPKVSINRL